MHASHLTRLVTLAALLLMATGCQHPAVSGQEARGQEHLGTQSNDVPTGSTRRVVYGTRHIPNTFLAVQEMGSNIDQLVWSLTNAGVMRVTFESDRKLTPKDVDGIVRALQSAGITVSEFWLPSSTDLRGEVDVMQIRP